MNDSEKVMIELNNKMVEAHEMEQAARQKKKRWLSVGKWIADNVIAIGALVVAIIALVRTI